MAVSLGGRLRSNLMGDIPVFLVLGGRRFSHIWTFGEQSMVLSALLKDLPKLPLTPCPCILGPGLVEEGTGGRSWYLFSPSSGPGPAPLVPTLWPTGRKGPASLDSLSAYLPRVHPPDWTPVPVLPSLLDLEGLAAQSIFTPYIQKWILG